MSSPDNSTPTTFNIGGSDGTPINISQKGAHIKLTIAPHDTHLGLDMDAWYYLKEKLHQNFVQGNRAEEHFESIGEQGYPSASHILDGMKMGGNADHAAPHYTLEYTAKDEATATAMLQFVREQAQQLDTPDKVHKASESITDIDTSSLAADPKRLEMVGPTATVKFDPNAIMYAEPLRELASTIRGLRHAPEKPNSEMLKALNDLGEAITATQQKWGIA